MTTPQDKRVSEQDIELARNIRSKMMRSAKDLSANSLTILAEALSSRYSDGFKAGLGRALEIAKYMATRSSLNDYPNGWVNVCFDKFVEAIQHELNRGGNGGE